MKYERPIKHFGFGHFQPLQVVSMPANLQDLHHLIAQGQHEAAALWLKTHASVFDDEPMGSGLLDYYTALCGSGDELNLWEKAIASLENTHLASCFSGPIKKPITWPSWEVISIDKETT